MKPKKHTFIKRDHNLELAYIAGQRARLEDKPLAKCPNLIPMFGEARATRLMDSWMRGWNDRDRELFLWRRYAAREARAC